MNSEGTFLPEPLPTAPSAEPPPPAPTRMPTSANGVNKCVSCGSSEVTFDGKWLVCGYCHNRWNNAVLADELHLSEGIENLVGTSVLTGAKNIDTSSLVTVKCDGCGAVVTINSETTLTATCHWCHHTLSLNHPVDNGAIPDAILPFYITPEDAAKRMAAYIADQGKFASPEFKRDFERAPIQGVYLPYLVVDGAVSVRLNGRAWTRGTGWTVSSGSDSAEDPAFKTDESAIMREMDLLVDDLAIEARSTRTKIYAAVSTTNIINAIQPFDVSNAVRFNANYISEGFGFESRDLGVSDAMGEAGNLFATMARGYVNQTLTQYNGGVRWESELIAIKGTRWVTVLLPLWLYGFKEDTATGPMMHYLAVNGRTGETEGSIPTDDTRAHRSGRRWGWGAAAIYEAVFGAPALLVASVFVIAALAGEGDWLAALFAVCVALPFTLPGVAIGKRVAKWRRDMLAQGQRKANARLKPEVESKCTPTRFKRSDDLLGTFTHHGGPEIDGRNDHCPDVRAARSQVVHGNLPEPAVNEHSTADGVWAAQSVTRFDDRGRRRAGQRYSAAPPGSRVARQLIPGWRDS